MKKLTAVVMTLLLASTFAFAQAPARTNIFGINPLGLVFNIYSGHFGKIIKDGANEVNIPFFYWSPTDDMTILGGGLKYRIYKDGNGHGVFYGLGASVMSISWDYESWDFVNGTTTETVTGISFTPGGEVGYRWSWDSGFTLAPTISLGYTVGKIESEDGTEADYGSGGLSWGLGIGLAYMW